MNGKRNGTGLSLIELALIASFLVILVGILYPILSSFITRANEAADLANARLLYTSTCFLAAESVSITPGIYSAEDDGEIPPIFSDYFGPSWPFPKAKGATAFRIVVKVNNSTFEYEIQRLFADTYEVYNPESYVFQ